MKARIIARLRKKIAAPGYYEGRMAQALRASRELETFWKFQCNAFFVSGVAARYNQRVYARDYPRVSARVEWYERKLFPNDEKQ